PRITRTTKGEERVHMNEYKPRYILAHPSRYANRYLLSLEHPPKTNYPITVFSLLAPCLTVDGLAVASSLSACRRTRRGELSAPRRRRDRHLHAFAHECLSHRLYGETWSTFLGGNRWDYMKNIHALDSRYATRDLAADRRTPASRAGDCTRKFAIARPQRL